MRIVGGQHRGRVLHSPDDLRIRPTSDRSREALFNRLEHRGLVRGARFLDLCAGSGAVGLEACSRGAQDVLLVERDPAAIRLIRQNVARLGDPPQVRVLQADANRLPHPALPYDLAFLDPPYGQGLAPGILASLAAGNWLESEATVIAEVAAKESLAVPAPFRIEDERRYGAARFVLLSMAPGTSP